jgi:hypothetical protein
MVAPHCGEQTFHQSASYTLVLSQVR